MAGDPPRAWHAKLTAMAMLFSHAEATERMVALPATADGGQKIDPEAARRACRLWLEALGVTRSRKSVHAYSQLDTRYRTIWYISTYCYWHARVVYCRWTVVY